MAELFRYAAFISYSSKDAAFARRLHRALESYSIPSSLGAFDLIGGGKKNRIYPVFRDREELSAGHLGGQIEANLRASAALIVVCSPNGATSPWVQKEIEYFAGLDRHSKIFAIIPDTAPLTDGAGADCTYTCFPPAFRGDALAGDTLEPLAADARKGKDGFRNAWLKIVAGMIGVSPGQIIDRDRKMVRRRRLAIGCTAAFAMVATLGVFAHLQTSSWRGALTAQAMRQVAESGDTLSALPWALAGAPSQGSLFWLGSPDNSNLTIVRSAVFPILDDVALTNSDVSTVLPFGEGGNALLIIYSDHTAELLNFGGERGRTRFARGTFDVFLDGPLLLAIGDNDLLSVYDSRTGEIVDLSSVELGHVEWVDNADDGSMLVFRRTSDQMLISIDIAAGGVVRELERMPGELQFSRNLVSPDGERLIRVEPNRQARVISLRGTQPQFPLGEVETDGIPEFSSDGVFYILERDYNRDDMTLMTTAFDLRRGGRRWDLGRILRHHIRSDAGAIVTQDADGRAVLLNLETEQEQDVGLVQDLGFLNDDRLLLVGRDGRVSIRDANGAVEVVGSVGSGVRRFSLSQDQSVIVAERGDGVAALRLTDGRAWTFNGVGPIASFQVSAEGESVVVVKDDEDGRFVLFDLIDDGTVIDFGPTSSSRLDVTPAASIASRRDEAGWRVFYDLSRGGAPYPIGRFATTQMAERVAISVGFDESVSIRSLAPSNLLDRPLVGDRFASVVCATSGSAVRPIARDETFEEFRAIFAGRPWNPCDWRGLLAIFPNGQRGDGWFEGLHQWLRLIQVRYFGGREWSCDEGTSRASETLRVRRREMCERFANGALARP